MADKGGKDEHRMLFDLRGKRRNVVKVVYAVLAVLMGLSLLLVAGPLPFGDIFGAQDAQEQAREQFEEQVERTERKLVKDPQNPQLLLTLTRAHVSAGSNLSEQDPTTGQLAVTPEGRQQYQQAASSWEEYLEATDEPASAGAQLMASTFFTLAQTARDNAEALANIEAASEAQKIVAVQRPSVGTLSTLSLYTVYTFDYAGAKQAINEAKKLATSKIQREQLDKQYDETRERAEEFEKGLKEEERLQKAVDEGEAAQNGSGGQGFTNPFGGGASISE